MSTPTTPTSAPAAAAVRPHNSYNLFFQLEREYILQTLFGFQPTIAPQNIFDPTNAKSNYSGPPLPSRYANLILPYDWHIPGKARRRKRSHRKSHGKIGFHELNEQISKAWSEADEETRRFCCCLSFVEASKYKVNKKTTSEEKKRRVTTENIDDDGTKLNSARRLTQDEIDFDNLVASIDWTGNGICPEGVDVASSDDNIGLSAPSVDRVVSDGSIRVRNTHMNESLMAEVDMEDDEIMALWKATPITDQVVSSSSVTLTRPSSMTLTRRVSTDEQQVDTRMLFINAQYEKFKEIGMKCSSAKPKFQGESKMESIAACQA